MVGQFSVCMQRFVGFYNLLEKHFSHLFSSYHYMFRPIWSSSGVSIRVSAPSAMQWSASASGFGRGVFMVFYAGFLCAWLRCFVVRPS
jgi:hypothetical protein